MLHRERVDKHILFETLQAATVEMVLVAVQWRVLVGERYESMARVMACLARDKTSRAEDSASAVVLEASDTLSDSFTIADS